MNIIRSIHFLLVLALIGCGGGGGGKFYIYESDIDEENPALFSQVAIYQLESPVETEAVKDTGGLGWDVIYLAGEKAESRIFCLDLGEGKNHRAQIGFDSNVDSVLIDNQTSCATIRMDSGRVKMSLIHDGVSARDNIFIYEANASSRAMFLKEYRSDPMTIISSSGCSSCNLANADLSNRDLKHTKFLGTNLHSANLSNSNLTSADLRNADLHSANLSHSNLTSTDLRNTNLADISTDGANFSRTIWNDGTVCDSSSNSVCDPFTFIVSANLPWQDTGILVRDDQRVRITYFAGIWSSNPADGMFTASGDPARKARARFALEGAPQSALIGQLNNLSFLVGKQETSPKGRTGLLALVINDDLLGIYGRGLNDNFGSVQVRFQITE